MKKIYLSVALFATFGILSAQQEILPSQMHAETVSSETVKAVMKSYNQRQKAQATKVIKSKWYEPAFAADTSLGYPATTKTEYLFPDSTITVHYLNADVPAYMHAIAECFDPTSYFYDGLGIPINKYMPYTVDSLSIYSFYRRKIASTTPDTLLVQLRLMDRYYALPSASYSWVQTMFGTDTLFFASISHDLDKPYSTDAGVVSFKYPLTVATASDTTAKGFNIIKINTNNFAVPKGRKFCVNYSFIPGYTWTLTDTLNKSKNYFRFVSNEENGNAQGNGTFPSYTKGDYTCSFVEYTSDMSLATFPPSYIRSDAAFPYEHHWVGALLTADYTGINNASNNDIPELKIYPNPTTNVLNVNVDGVYNWTIYNLLGAAVKEGKGANMQTINVNDITPGTYYIKIQDKKGRLATRKVLVTK